MPNKKEDKERAENQEEVQDVLPPSGTIPLFYADGAQLTITGFDIRLTFSTTYLNPDSNQWDVKQAITIAMSPQHAKLLWMLLRNNVERYEKQSGQVNLPEEMLTRAQEPEEEPAEPSE